MDDKYLYLWCTITECMVMISVTYMYYVYMNYVHNFMYVRMYCMYICIQLLLSTEHVELENNMIIKQVTLYYVRTYVYVCTYVSHETNYSFLFCNE